MEPMSKPDDQTVENDQDEASYIRWAVAQVPLIRESLRLTAAPNPTTSIKSVRDVGVAAIAVLGPVAYVVGQYTVTLFARRFDVSANDLGLDSRVHAAIAGVWFVVLATITGLFIAGGRLAVRLHPWLGPLTRKEINRSAAIVLVGFAIIFGASLGFGGPTLAGSLVIVFVCTYFGFVPIWIAGPSDDRTVRRRIRLVGWMVAALLLIPFAAWTIGDADSLARYAYEQAVADEEVPDPDPWLGAFVRVARGTVTLPDGSQFCGVRISTDVFLVSAADFDSVETLVVKGATFTTDRRDC